VYYPIKQYIVYQTRNLPFEERQVILETALATNDILVRRAVAESTPVIPEAFKLQYETLLKDNSYQTKEIALTNLWKNFPEDRLRYLEQTKDIEGNNDKSFRLTWLALAMNTENLTEQVKTDSYNQLLDFASQKYENSVRQNALELLLQMNPNDGKVIELLFKTTIHHKWQFTKFGRDNVRRLLKNKEFRTKVEQLASTSDEKMKDLYFKFLNEK
jgi:aminopeptidase N